MRYILLLALQTIFLCTTNSQSISSIISEFNQDSLVKTVREFSGEDSVIINGTKTIIKKRAAYLGLNLAEEYLKTRLAGYKLEVQTQKYSINGLNVFGIQKGTKYPDEFYLVGAHHDAVTDYCADDNASGCAAIMETARVLSKNSFEYTLIYMFWDEEEAGLWGSSFHAKQAKANNQVFKGIIVMDMIGYDSNNDRKFDIHVYPDPVSLSLTDSIKNIISIYNLNLDPQIINPGSDRGDHYAYWKQGIYGAIGISERIFTDDPNPAYHTENDRIGLFNIPYFAEISKMTVGLMATLAKPSTTQVGNRDKDSRILGARIFPNPTNSFLHIEIEDNHEISIQIFDIYGRIIDHKKSQSAITSFDFRSYMPGIYTIALINKKNTLIVKIIKTD